MATFKSQYDSNNQAITITLASLGNGASQQSASVDNSTNQYLDVLVQLVIKSGASAVSATGYVNVYAYGTADGGTDFAEGCTGNNTGLQLTSPTNLRLIGTVNVVANATSYTSEPMSVAAAFGGVMPQKWGIVVENESGAGLDATEGNHKKFYQGVWGQSV